MIRSIALLALMLLGLGCSDGQGGGGAGDLAFSAEVFAHPPRELGPQARWWWPGGAVDDATLRQELGRFAELGYSAVEIQPFMSAVTGADLSEDARIRTVGDARFLEHLANAACEAREIGLAWDLTLGSGWSTAGPDVGDDGERQLIAAELTLEGPSSYQGPLPSPEPPSWIDATNGILPAIDGFDPNTTRMAVLGAEVLDEPVDSPVVLGEVIDLGSMVQSATLSWEVPPGTFRVFAMYENQTRHFAVGNAYPGALEQARIIDHLDHRGVDAFLQQEFEAWIDAVTDCPPRAVFVDSFELVGELPWTTSLAAGFQSSFGYDVTPSLPFLFLDGGESEYVNIFGRPPPRYRASDEHGARVREDYEAFRGTLFAQNMIGVLHDWLEPRGIDLRLQAHGGYADVLDAYALAEVPESEGLYAGGSYDFLRLAASAAEVAGQRFASSETFVSLGALELSEAEARLLIGRAFSAGINRLVHHGHAYSYSHTDGQRWYPFHPLPDSAVTTGPLDISFDLHPGAEIWAKLPELNQMQARLSYAMSRGSAVVQVAWLYPQAQADNFSSFGVEPGAFESDTSQALRRAGYAYTRVSRGALSNASAQSALLEIGEASFQALLIDEVHAIDPEVLRGALRALDAGVPVIWLGGFPERASGWADAESRDAEVRDQVETLRQRVRLVSSVDAVPGAIADAGVLPALQPVSPGGFQLSVTQRRVAGGDLYLLFNESYEERTEQIRLASGFGGLSLLDPDTGQPIEPVLDADVLTVTLGAARGLVLTVER